MVNVTITAEDFSQLYASLETLEVKQIVTTLMEIAPLRDEIKKRVTPRKRRTKAMMMADALLSSYEQRQPSFLKIEQDVGNNDSPTKRKPRKSVPIKLHPADIDGVREKIGVGQAENTMTEPSPNVGSASLDCSKVIRASRETTLQDQQHALSAEGVERMRSARQYSAFNLFSSFNPGVSATPPAFTNPLAYWSWYRLAAQQPMGNLMLPRSVPTAPPMLYQHFQPNQIKLSPESNRRSPEALKAHEHSTDDRLLCVTRQSGGQLHGSSEEISAAVQFKDRTVHLEEPIDVEESYELKVESQAPISVTCPDCKQLVLLASLHRHLEGECKKDSLCVSPSISSQSPVQERYQDFEENPCMERSKHNRPKHRSLNSKFNCSECRQVFKNKSSLKRHMITHTDGGGFACSLCGKVFAKPELLKRHVLIHSETAKNLWPCAHCGKGFSNKYNLAVHERIHTGEMPFECIYCQERFRVKCSMQNHIKSKHSSICSAASSPLASSPEASSSSPGSISTAPSS